MTCKNQRCISKYFYGEVLDIVINVPDSPANFNATSLCNDVDVGAQIRMVNAGKIVSNDTPVWNVVIIIPHPRPRYTLPPYI